MKFVFLVLHYKNADITMNCIDSILSTQTGREFEVVIVDNASGNGSLEQLREKYDSFSNIYFVENRENLGYARGNNAGFQFAKKELQADWICLANNDVVFTDTQWITKIVEEYNRKPFYVLGPDIITPDGTHQNPFAASVPDKKAVSKKLFHDRVVYLLLKLGIQRKLKQAMNLQTDARQVDRQTTGEDFHGVLHGSCLVFSPDFIKEFDGFYNGTFLYAEEEILCYILSKLRRPYTYLSTIQVEHRHSMSFKRAIDDEDKRKMTIVKNRIKSYQKFAKIIRSGDKLERYLKG